MNQQIKTNIKYLNQEPSVKIAFQANIFKYIERKKQQVSVIGAFNKKYGSSDERIHSNCSNLISKQKQSIRKIANHSNNSIQEICSNQKVNLQQIKISQNPQQAKRKNKGHKSSLSDWRNLYQQRNQITSKQQFKNITPEKMIVTDRLFYPVKKQNCTKNISDSEPYYNHSQNSSHQKLNKRFLNTISNFNKTQKEKYFVSDQNFFHMYHRSYSPILSDFAEKKRIVNYLRDNKERKLSNNGLRLMNEGIFAQAIIQDINFVPYKNQQIQTERKNLRNLQIQKKNQLELPAQIFQSQYLNRKVINLRSQIHNKKGNNIALINPELQEQKNIAKNQSPRQTKIKEGEVKQYLNLSQICSETLESKMNETDQNNQIKLKLFKARRNKIQKGIFNVNKFKSQVNHKFANFQYSLTKPRLRSTHSNWMTVKNQF